MKSNDSFRKLLEEVRSAPEKKPGEPAAQASAGHKKKSQGSEKYRRLLAARRNESDEAGPTYRDRADERRKEITSDKVDVTLGDETLNVSADMSKYLGGDMTHTHLVRGLDYALLNKVKSELDKSESNPKFDVASDPRKELRQTNKGLRGNVTATNAGKKVVNKMQPHTVRGIATHTQLGKCLSFFLTSSTHEIASGSHRVIETLAFEFNLHADKFDAFAEIPITISRSRLNLDEGAEDMMMGNEKDSLAQSAAQVLKQYRLSGKKSKSKKKLTHDVEGAVKVGAVKRPLTLVDDIFEDVGQYVPVVDDKKSEKRTRWDVSDGDYFGNLRAMTKEEADSKDDDAQPRVTDILKGVKNLAAVSDRIGSRKQAKGSAMDGEGEKYGETFDFDFGGDVETRDD